MRSCLLNPMKYYECDGENTLADNASAYFDSLVEKSCIDRIANETTSSDYKKVLHDIDILNKQIKKYKVYRILCYITFIFIVGAVLYYCNIKKKLSEFIDSLETLNNEADKLLNTANNQIAPLNAIFSEKDIINVIEKTLPEIHFDEFYTAEKHKYCMDYFGFNKSSGTHNSTLCVHSGDFCGNPFVFIRNKMQEMGTCLYTGSIVISWQESYKDKDGRTRTRTVHQTLTASVNKPKPYYKTFTVMHYGSDAAPDLSFSRNGQHIEKLTKKQIDKTIKKGAKNFRKRSQISTTNGGTFLELVNSTFEVLFNAHDRNNEVQYRLLFTPLAQQNMVELLKSRKGFGDDFTFIKKGKHSTITSEHAQKWHMSTSPAAYRSYCVSDSKKAFISCASVFFKSIFFDMAPMIAIPAYCDGPSKKFETQKGARLHYSNFEIEALANEYGPQSFANPDFETDIILKVESVESRKDEDVAVITAKSFYTEPRTDYIQVYGGDGRFHTVPVNWLEYIPTQHSSIFYLKAEKGNSDHNLKVHL